MIVVRQTSVRDHIFAFPTYPYEGPFFALETLVDRDIV